MQCTLRVFGNRVVRGMFGLKREEVMGLEGNYIMSCFIICTTHQIFLELPNRG
jgi:hypothetical protein